MPVLLPSTLLLSPAFCAREVQIVLGSWNKLNLRKVYKTCIDFPGSRCYIQEGIIKKRLAGAPAVSGGILHEVPVFCLAVLFTVECRIALRQVDEGTKYHDHACSDREEQKLLFVIHSRSTLAYLLKPLALFMSQKNRRTYPQKYLGKNNDAP